MLALIEFNPVKYTKTVSEFIRQIMTALKLAIQEAFNASDDTKKANKAYLEFIKANFIIPVEHSVGKDNPKVLFLQDQEQVYLPVFTEMHYLDAWACDIATEIQVLKLSGVDLLKGLGDKVTVCLNLGSDIYKEFNPSETARMRSMVLKFFKN